MKRTKGFNLRPVRVLDADNGRGKAGKLTGKFHSWHVPVTRFSLHWRHVPVRFARGKIVSLEREKLYFMDVDEIRSSLTLT